MRKWLGMGLCVSLGVTLLVGCGSNSSTPGTTDTAKKQDQTLKLALDGEVPSLDSSLTTDTLSFDILGQVEEGLVRLDQKGNVTEGIAKSWKQSPDGLTYTFTLRDDAKWSDGSPVTAQDFEYAWKRTLNPDTKAEYAFMLEWIKGGEAYNSGKGSADDVAVKALDNKTLTVTLTSPKPFFLAQLAFPVFFPQKQAFVEKEGKKYGADANTMLYDGPFTVTGWTHDQSMDLAKNNLYWDKENVKLDHVQYQVVKDSATKENLYQTGALDRIGLVRDQTDHYKGKPEFSRHSDLATGYVMFNYKIPVLQNANIRKALTYAINADQFADVVYHDGTTGATGMVPTGTSAGDGVDFRQQNGDLIDRKDNSPKAQDFLKKGLQELGLKEFPHLKLLLSDSATSKKSGEFIQAQWKQNLGIDVELEMVPFKLRQQRTKDRAYDMVFTNWGADYNDPMTFLDLWISDSSGNRCGYSNPEYDKLVKDAQTQADPKKRMQELYQGEKILLNDMGVGPVYFSSSSYAMKTYVKGWVDRSFGAEYDLKYTYIDGK